MCVALSFLPALGKLKVGRLGPSHAPKRKRKNGRDEREREREREREEFALLEMEGCLKWKTINLFESENELRSQGLIFEFVNLPHILVGGPPLSLHSFPFFFLSWPPPYRFDKVSNASLSLVPPPSSTFPPFTAERIFISSSKPLRLLLCCSLPPFPTPRGPKLGCRVFQIVSVYLRKKFFYTLQCAPPETIQNAAFLFCQH